MIFQAQNLTTTQLLFLFFYAAGMLLQIFAPNYLAQEVLEKCYLLPDSAFSSEWFKLNEIEKKAMLLFITRSIHPLKVHAGDFFEMNIDTFLRVIIFKLFGDSGIQKDMLFALYFILFTLF